MEKVVKKRKISVQKIFNLISLIFLFSCIIFYGTRFIKLYIENNKVEEVESLAKTIKKDNESNENFKNINGEYYFVNKENNNYVKYSNLNWRIIKINSDNSITLVMDNSITSLANSKEYINDWLNNDYEEDHGILKDSLNNITEYLTFSKTCNNNVNDTKKVACETTTKDIYITIPSINDYINTGASNSFMNNEEYFYLINKTDDNKYWYVDSEGKIGKNDGSDIIGIKPVITIKNTISNKEGNGTKDNPYTFEEKTSLFASYVKLDNDIWRIYEVNNDTIKLSLNNYLTINSEEIKYNYSKNDYYHNDTTKGSLAYYLNKTYLDSLSYKDLIEETEFANGIYNNTTDYNYIDTLETNVKTKVSLLSIGNPILNPTLTNYFTSTGIEKDNSNIYVMQNDFKLYTKSSSTSLKVVPVISINKNLLTKGTGTIDNPLEVE